MPFLYPKVFILSSLHFHNIVHYSLSVTTQCFSHNTSFLSEVLCLPVVPIADPVPLIRSSLVASYPAECTYSGMTWLVKKLVHLNIGCLLHVLILHLVRKRSCDKNAKTFALSSYFIFSTCVSHCVSLLWLLGNVHICNIVNSQLFCFSYMGFILFHYCDRLVMYTSVTLWNVCRCLCHCRNCTSAYFSEQTGLVARRIYLRKCAPARFQARASEREPSVQL